jgi:3-oxoacyl-[acyl-carrier-protein] synthase II
MTGRRVFITGIGLICPLGSNVEAFWRNALEGQQVAAPIPPRWLDFSDFKSRYWSPLPEIDFTEYGLKRIERMRLDPVTMLAIGATDQALKQANIPSEQTDKRGEHFQLRGIDPRRTGVYMGTGIGGIQTTLETHSYQVLAKTREQAGTLVAKCDAGSSLAQQGASLLDRLAHPLRFNPFAVSMLMSNAVSALLGIRYGIRGPNVTCAVACASGTAAIGQAYDAVRNGTVDVAICGGAEYLYDDHGAIFRGYDIAGTLSHGFNDPEQANRPFDRRRNGFLFSQGGSAVLILESASHAKARGVGEIAEVAGFAQTFDAHSVMSLAPDGSEIARMMADCLDDAGAKPAAVGYINGHGTGTLQNDEVESDVLSRTFGSHPVVNSTKSLIGHTIGASGSIEAAVTALTLRDGKTHPVGNLQDPIADLNFARSANCGVDTELALTYSFAFGGHNAALALKRRTQTS